MRIQAIVCERQINFLAESLKLRKNALHFVLLERPLDRELNLAPPCTMIGSVLVKDLLF